MNNESFWKVMKEGEEHLKVCMKYWYTKRDSA